jgi:hypothetical protein
MIKAACVGALSATCILVSVAAGTVGTAFAQASQTPPPATSASPATQASPATPAPTDSDQGVRDSCRPPCVSYVDPVTGQRRCRGPASCGGEG